MNSSRPGGSCPVSPASRNKPKISACDPRWESTWAIDHSLAYERCSSSARPRGSTLARKRSWECRSALIHGAGLGSMFSLRYSPAYLEEIHWAAYSCIRPCPEDTLHIVYPEPMTARHQPPRRLRADAARNRAAIVAVAREVFAEQGLAAPLEAIAARAGVGIATLYRRFPTREKLVAAALTEKVAEYAEAAEQALAAADPWVGFAGFVQRI